MRPGTHASQRTLIIPEEAELALSQEYDELCQEIGAEFCVCHSVLFRCHGISKEDRTSLGRGREQLLRGSFQSICKSRGICCQHGLTPAVGVVVACEFP